MQVCVFTLQLWKTDDAKLPFNMRLIFTHLITQYMERKKMVLRAGFKKKCDFTLNEWFMINIEEKIPVRNVLSR
jgi:hypothetical protein